MVTPASVAEKYLAMPVNNKDSGKRSITQMLVVHSAECPLEAGYAKSLTSWLNQYPPAGPWASINTFADPAMVVRSVHTDNASWHASWANSLSVGYETAAYAAFNRSTWLSLAGRRMLERLAIEMAADAKRYNIPLRWLTGAQVNAIKAGNRKIKGLAAHRQIDPANRTDPGDGFPYGYLLKRIKHHSGVQVKPAAPKGDPIDVKDQTVIPDWRFCEQTNGHQNVKKGEWATVEIEDGSGRTAICDGSEANLVIAHGNVYIKGVAEGYAAKVEWARWDAHKDKYERAYGAVEIKDTAGGEQGEVTTMVNLPRGDEEQLVMRIFAYQDIVVETARARAFWWK